MDGHVGHLHCNYQVIGADSSPGVVMSHLDRVAQEYVAEALDNALDQSLGDDPTVYVLRRVWTRVAISLNGILTDSQLSQRWGERLAGAVVGHIANDPENGTNLVRFADQADYVAHFVIDLLQGKAWSRWFYGAFSSLRPRGKADALKTVLLENKEHLPSILSYLYRYDELELFLATLDGATLQLLWSHGLGAYIRPDPETLRPFFANALRLMDRLGLWAQASPGGGELFQAYLANKPPPVDWRDRTGLTSAVLEILCFMAERGYLRRWGSAQDEAFLHRLDEVLADFDWLDTARLRASLLELAVESGGKRIDLPPRPPDQGPTLRQRELLADLAALLCDGGLSLDLAQPDSLANALRLYAMLVARTQQWSGDPLATGMIHYILAAWAALGEGPSPRQAMDRVGRGDIDGALLTLPEGSRDRALRALKFLNGLGRPAMSIVKTLIGDDAQELAVTSAAIETNCAGLFLLLRAILDVRVAMLVEEARYPLRDMSFHRPVQGPTPLASVLVALGLRWAGEMGVAKGRMDPGLALLAGMERAPTIEVLREIWSDTGPADHSRFQEAFLRTLAGQRFVQGPVLHLCRVTLGDGHTALVAGDEMSGIWPLGRVIQTDEDVVGILAGWLKVWEGATGHRPVVVANDDLLADMADLEHDFKPQGGVGPEMASPGSSRISGESAPANQTGLDTLRADLHALDYGRLSLPDVDLTMALAAIALLRGWARWLRQFGSSSLPYLLDNFIRRPGQVYPDTEYILVEMESRPLDLVIEMAGYTSALETIPWLGNRHVRFQMRGG